MTETTAPFGTHIQWYLLNILFVSRTNKTTYLSATDEEKHPLFHIRFYASGTSYFSTSELCWFPSFWGRGYPLWWIWGCSKLIFTNLSLNMCYLTWLSVIFPSSCPWHVFPSSRATSLGLNNAIYSNVTVMLLHNAKEIHVGRFSKFVILAIGQSF